MMISDTLSDARAEIYQYLQEFPECYQGEAKGKIVALLDHMEQVRRMLDAPPPTSTRTDQEGE